MAAQLPVARSTPCDDTRRALLELNQNIQSLRTRLGDCPELVGVTGQYHNLLRQRGKV